jgi:hypothetical protein
MDVRGCYRQVAVKMKGERLLSGSVKSSDVKSGYFPVGCPYCIVSKLLD